MMDVHKTYCGNHFITNVIQIIKLYTLHLYRAVCQLYFNKTGRKKEEKGKDNVLITKQN